MREVLPELLPIDTNHGKTKLIIEIPTICASLNKTIYGHLKKIDKAIGTDEFKTINQITKDQIMNGSYKSGYLKVQENEYTNQWTKKFVVFSNGNLYFFDKKDSDTFDSQFYVKNAEIKLKGDGDDRV